VSGGESAESRSAVLDVLEVEKLFREDFNIEFKQHILCSDAPAPVGQGAAFCMRSSSLSDIQHSLHEILRGMVASRDGGKHLSLLVHLNMPLSSQDGGSLSNGSADAGSSDGLVAVFPVVRLITLSS
jgi:hypothetical protein